MEPPIDNPPVKIGVICQLLGVSRSTIYRWEDAGVIAPVYRTPGGTRLYDLEAVRTALGLPGRSYGATAYNPSGTPENPANCVYKISGHGDMVSRQCSLKRGQGPGGLYCRQHAKIIESRLEAAE